MATVWPFPGFMIYLALAAINAQLVLLAIYGDRYEGIITNYIEIVNNLSRQYSTDAVITKADEVTENLSEAPRCRGMFPKHFRT